MNKTTERGKRAGISENVWGRNGGKGVEENGEEMKDINRVGGGVWVSVKERNFFEQETQWWIKRVSQEY